MNDLLRLLLSHSKARKTSRLNKDQRWIFENNRGLLFIYNVNNRRVQVRNRDISYRNNGQGIIPLRRSVTVKYRAPQKRRRRRD